MKSSRIPVKRSFVDEDLIPSVENYSAPSAPQQKKNYQTIYGVFLLIGAIFLAVSLLSYNANDSCINVSSDEKIRNIGGSYGALVADLLLQLLGFGSGVLVCIVAVWAVAVIAKVEISFMWLRMPAMLLSACSISGLFGMFTGYNFAKQMLPGGYIGFFLQDKMSHMFGAFISVLIYIASFIFFGYCSIGIDRERFARINDLFVFLGRWFGKLVAFFGVIFRIITLQFIFDIFSNRKKIMIMAKEVLVADEPQPVKRSRAMKTSVSSNFNAAIKDSDDEPEIFYGTPRSGDRMIEVEKMEKSGTLEKTIPASAAPMDKSYKVPSVELLKKISGDMQLPTRQQIDQKVASLIKALADFGIKGKIVHYHVGPVVTLYELQPQAGTKASRVVGLAADIARTMQVVSVRISAVPGKDVLGIELPNKTRQPVSFRHLIESNDYINTTSAIPIILGKNIMGEPVIADLTKMPHLLIAGTTGSGKSVGMNTMILSILYKMSPENCKFIMIDPKMLEFSMYDGIPHLLTPVITDPKKAILALKWVVGEMTKRYRLMSNLGVRNINGYNDKVAIAKMRGGQIVREVEVGYEEDGSVITEKISVEAKTMSYIVVVIDEMADLMLVAGKEIESLVQRLAQMARAAGIHLVMATQRPSVDVITGVIKANFPTRVSYQVTSKIDSRTILGEQGAEQLLGNGDMLHMSLGNKITRVHGAYVSDDEVGAVVSHLKSQGPSAYIDIAGEMLNALTDEEGVPMSYSGSGTAEDFGDNSCGAGGDEGLYQQAVKIVQNEGKTSISYVQRRLRIGYNKAANFIERMQKDGILTPADLNGKRTLIKDSSND